MLTSDPPLPSTPSRRLLQGLTWVFLLLAAFLAYRSAADMGNHNTDFSLYYFGGVVERSSTYTDTHEVLRHAAGAGRAVAPEGVYGSPTLVGLFYQPLSYLRIDVAETLFAVFAAAMLAIGVRRAAGNAWWPAWLAVAVLATSNVLAFGLGNFAIITTALVLFTYGSLQQKRPASAGIALGFAIAMKLYPVFLLLPLLVKREKQTVTWASCTTALLFLATPFALGWSSTLDAVRQTFDVASLVHPWTDNTGLPGFVLHNTNNQSLAQWTSRIALVASVLFLWQMRKLPTTALFALSVLLMCVSQGISWNMYYGVTMVALLSLRDLHPSRTYWAAAAIGYVITTGILLHATYFLFGLSRGMPITIGLLTTTAIYAAVALQSPANRNLAHP